MRSESTWILDFDRPDVLALANHPDLRRPLADAVNTATQSVLTTYQLSGRRVTWPTRRGVTAGLLAVERGDGETPVIVDPASVPGWGRRLGSLVSYDSTNGPVPLLVNDVLADVPGGTSVVSLRQRILSDAALAGLQRAIDTSSRADAVTIVDPTVGSRPAAHCRQHRQRVRVTVRLRLDPRRPAGPVGVEISRHGAHHHVGQDHQSSAATGRQ